MALKINNANYDEVMGKGLPVVIDFWATWCGPCMREVPHLKEAYTRFHGKGFEIYSMSIDKEDDKFEFGAAFDGERYAVKGNYTAKGKTHTFEFKDVVYTDYKTVLVDGRLD